MDLTTREIAENASVASRESKNTVTSIFLNQPAMVASLETRMAAQPDVLKPWTMP
jgi:hypothetical protein